MCCCGQPTINGQPGFRWQPNDPPSVYPVNPPALGDGDELLYDEPGRCGGTDCHCHHYRIVRPRHRGGIALYVRHGAGNERIDLHGHGAGSLEPTIATLDTTARYWLLHAIYYAYHDGERKAADKCNSTWTQAAAEKRIKTRKNSRRGTVKVWIESATKA